MIVLISLDEKYPIWYYFAAKSKQSGIFFSKVKAASMAWEQRSSCLLLMMPRQSQALQAAFFISKNRPFQADLIMLSNKRSVLSV